MKTNHNRIRAMMVMSAFTILGVFSSSGLAGELGSVTHLSSGEAARLGTLKTGDQLVVHSLNGKHVVAGHNINFTDFSGVFGQSSDTAYVLVASGQASVDGKQAKPGHVLILMPYGGQTVVQHYDAKRFTRAWPETAVTSNPDIHDAFMQVARNQKWGLFFGRYASTSFNVAAPGSAPTELARRSIVGSDVVQSIRFSSANDPAEVERAVVETFTRALANGDAKTVASLMDPSPFGFSDLRGGADGARLLMAKKLLASRNWSSWLRGAQFLPKSENGVWQINGDGGRTDIILKPIGDFTFIQSINTGA